MSKQLSSQLLSQAPCNTSIGYCLSFSRAISLDLSVFNFTASSKGKADVTFHGSLYCGNNGATDTGVLDLTTQIVATNAGEANASGPGGLRHAGVIGARASTTFNLVSTRVLTLAKAGSVTVRLRIAPSRIDGIVSCYFYNAAFTVLFVP